LNNFNVWESQRDKIISEISKWWRKDVGEWIQCTYCVYMHVIWKMIPVETIPVMGSEKMKEEGRGCIWYTVRTFANATMYPQPAQQ
jgi:hypothetical protein